MSDLGNIAGGGGNAPPGGPSNQLGGFSPLPQPSGQGGPSDGINAPGVGRIKRGETPVHTEHEYHKAIFDKVTKASHIIDRMREEVDKLADMGDTVSPEDVVSAAGRLAGHGVPTRELATLLADMPTQAGQGLAAWIAQHEQALQQQEALIQQVTRVAGHQMAVSGMRVLAAHALRDQMGRMAAASQGMAAQGGPLAPGQAPAGPALSPGLPQGQPGGQ